MLPICLCLSLFQFIVAFVLPPCSRNYRDMALIFRNFNFILKCTRLLYLCGGAVRGGKSDAQFLDLLFVKNRRLSTGLKWPPFSSGRRLLSLSDSHSDTQRPAALCHAFIRARAHCFSSDGLALSLTTCPTQSQTASAPTAIAQTMALSARPSEPRKSTCLPLWPPRPSRSRCHLLNPPHCQRHWWRRRYQCRRSLRRRLCSMPRTCTPKEPLGILRGRTLRVSKLTRQLGIPCTLVLQYRVAHYQNTLLLFHENNSATELVILCHFYGRFSTVPF